VLLELALALAHPPLPPLGARHDPLRVELERHLLGRLRLGPGLLAQRGELVLAPELPPRLAKELAPALRRAQLLGQLITARLAIELILGLVGRPGLGEDLARDPVELVVELGAGVPAIRVPSIDTTPGLTNPARSDSLSTSPNSSDNARSCRQRNRAIVA
jgi:hypothetical protein